MVCKNCENTLRTDFSYCPDCGAKVIRNRITFKNLWFDIIERYFNLDNTFLKTFLHLLTKPEQVVESYLSGTRRKYLNPISHLAISLTLSGFSLFLMKKLAWDKIDFTGFGGNMSSEGMQKIMNFTLDYSAVVNLMYIPIVAFAGFAMFNKKGYFLSEHLVTAMYSLANFSILSFFFSVFWLLLSPENYFKTSFFVIGLMLLYTMYVHYRTSINYWVYGILRGLGYALVFGVGFFGVGIVLNILMLLLGVIELKDMLPPPK